MQTVILLQNEIAPLPKIYDEIAPPYVKSRALDTYATISKNRDIKVMSCSLLRLWWRSSSMMTNRYCMRVHLWVAQLISHNLCRELAHQSFCSLKVTWLSHDCKRIFFVIMTRRYLIGTLYFCCAVQWRYSYNTRPFPSHGFNLWGEGLGGVAAMFSVNHAVFYRPKVNIPLVPLIVVLYLSLAA